MAVFENECKKTNTRSQTQKYLSLGKFTLAPLCEPHKIEIVQEKRQVTFIAIVVGRHESMPCLLAHNSLFEAHRSFSHLWVLFIAESCELQTIKDRAIVRWGDTDAVGMRILAAKKLNMEKQKLWYT